MTWFFIRILSVGLRSLEKLLVQCMAQVDEQAPPESILRAELLLGMKATACLRATLRLLEQGMWQEAETTRRTFLETWALMMYFAWFPEEPVLSVWNQDPEAYLGEARYHIREKVEPLVPKLLQMAEKASLGLREDFRFVSNRAVHPTRESAERSWSDAAWRWRRLLPKKDVRERREWRLYNLQLSLALLASYVHLFVRFLRIYVLSLPEAPDSFRLKHPSYLETFLTLWLKLLKGKLLLAVEKAKAEAEEKGLR